MGFFTQLQRTFYAKKRFYNDKKEPFWHKGSLQHFVAVIILGYCLLNCCSNLTSHFNYADFWRRTEMALFVCDINYIK